MHYVSDDARSGWSFRRLGLDPHMFSSLGFRSALSAVFLDRLGCGELPGHWKASNRLRQWAWRRDIASRDELLDPVPPNGRGDRHRFHIMGDLQRFALRTRRIVAVRVSRSSRMPILDRMVTTCCHSNSVAPRVSD